MDINEMAATLWRQLPKIAEREDYVVISRVDFLVGSNYSIDGQALTQGLEPLFHGSCFDGAVVNVTVLAPGDEYIPPNQDQATTSNGWELFVSCLEGTK